MPRVKGGARAHQRHNKVLKLAKGYRGTRSKLYRRANEAVLRAGEHAFKGRKEKKRDFRQQWITRLNAALTPFEISYSRFIKGLKDSNITLNRKMLSEIAIRDPKGFGSVVTETKKNLK